MASSINFLNWFGGENWFHKPSKPISLSPSHTNFILSSFSRKTHPSSPLPNFACISSSNNLSPTPISPAQPPPPPQTDGSGSGSDSESPPSTKFKEMLEQFFWECENLPDYRHTPEVENILNDSVVEDKPNPTKEEIEENTKWWDSFNNSSVMQFLKQAQFVGDVFNQRELSDNREPFRSEDTDLWKAVPNVPGLDGRPMPRKAIKTPEEADDKFWDFTKQFFFGLWGFRQRPYPPGRPIDVAQAIGYKKLERRYYDFIMRSGGWYYKDRLGRTRGPLELITLKSAWGAGIIDKDTFIWGDDMDEWAPIHMVYGLEQAVATWEVRLGAAATAFIHKLMNGIPPWVPVKGHEVKTYKQVQKEAIESKRRDLAVLEANDGIWPGVRTPSHALFLWASGSELTTILEADHMPNKYIPKDLRIQLAKAIPGLRPWEILSVEQAMDQITYGGEWYREPLGSYTTGPPYIRDWNDEVEADTRSFLSASEAVVELLEESNPWFGSFIEEVEKVSLARMRAKEEKRNAEKRAEEEINIFGRPISKA